MREPNLLPQLRRSRRRDGEQPLPPDRSSQTRRRERRDFGSIICVPKIGERGVEEEVPRFLSLDEGERGRACSDRGDRADGGGVGESGEGGEPAMGAERFEGGEDVGVEEGAVRLVVDEELESLLVGGVKDAAAVMW